MSEHVISKRYGKGLYCIEDGETHFYLSSNGERAIIEHLSMTDCEDLTISNDDILGNITIETGIERCYPVEIIKAAKLSVKLDNVDSEGNEIIKQMLEFIEEEDFHFVNGTCLVSSTAY